MNGKKKNKIDKLLLGSPDMGAPMQPYQSQDMVMSNAGAWTSVHNIFMQAPVAIMVLSGNNYIVESANDFYLKIIEKDKDFIGKPIFDSLPELESQGIRQLLDTVMESGIPYNGYEMEVHLNRDDKKSQGFYNFVYQPIREQDNTISGIIVVASEVTEQVLARKRIEESLQQYQYHTMTHSSPSAIGILQGADLIITTANEEKFRLLVQQAPVAICVLRGENYVIEVINEPMYEMWDRTLEQVLNKPVFDVLTELKDQGFKELLDNVYHNGERFVAEELPLSLKRDGKLDNIFVKFVYEPLREADGTISGVMALAHDITQQVVARKKIKESESHFRLIAELMPEKIINAKPDGTIFYYNKSWQDYTGASFDELIRDGWEKWVHPEAAAEAIQHWQHSIETGDNFDMEFQMLCHTGDYRWHTSRARSVKDENGNTKLWIGFNSDIHDQKIQKQELQQAVAIRTSALLRANEELQQKNQEIALSKYNKRFLTEFSEKFNSYKLNNEIFNSLVEYIADVTELNYVFIGKLYPNDADKKDIQTIALTAFGKLVENINYPLSDGPCENIIHDATMYAYSENCRTIFPKNQTLAKFNVEGYVGLCLYDGQGNPIGVVAAMHEKKIEDVETVASILKIVAKRAEMEFERIKNKEELEENNKALEEQNQKLEKINQQLELKNKEIEEAKEKLLSEYSRSLIEASLDPLITLSTEGVITDMNEAFATITGETREQLIGSDFSNYFTDPQKAREIYQEVFAKGFVTNYPLTIVDGEPIDVLFNGSVYKDDKGNVLGAVVVARVITEMKRFEKELVEAKVFAELATVIAEEAQSKAEDAVKSKQQFLSNMSHEIRTPMNAIIGFTKVALKTDLTPKQKEYLNAIKMSGDTLIVLINDILDLAKVDAGKMAFEHTPFKMAASITAMLHLFESKIQEKNLDFIKKYDDRIPQVLVGDPVRLHQIIMNLVSNAVKFTSEGRITVSVKMLSEDDQNVTIKFAVTDTGIGIEKENIEKIFESFHQATTDTSRLYGGTGLGLNIAKQLVEQQGGIIHVKSKMTEGSTFSFILTFQKTQAEAAFLPALLELDNDIKNIKVLVVEDMALNQLLMKTLLDDFGFERDIANNGKIAIEKLTQKDEFGAFKTYDVILMDLQMPVMNGFEATAYIRNVLHSKIPIIALTADVTTADLAKCKAVGMDDYISKPVDEKLLYTKIVNLVKKPADIETHQPSKNTPLKLMKYTDLAYLIQRTKNNPALIAEMIEAYLEQTPPLVSAMKQSLLDKDWDTLHGAVHKMIPSFAIIGMNADFEIMAKKIQEYARSQQQLEDIHDMVTQLEHACTNACKELEIEFKRIKVLNHDSR